MLLIFANTEKTCFGARLFFVRYVRARNINKERVGRFFLLFETNNPFLLVVSKGIWCYNETKKRFYNQLGGIP